SFARRLDAQRKAKLGDDLHPIGVLIDDAIARRRNAAREPHELRAPLVHRERRGHDAASGVRDAERLQRALHGAVFAEAPMQRDERALKAIALQLEQIAHGGIEWIGIDPFFAQRAEHGVAREKRDLALRRWTAHQHGNFAEFSHRRTRTRLALSSRANPLLSSRAKPLLSSRAKPLLSSREQRGTRF